MMTRIVQGCQSWQLSPTMDNRISPDIINAANIEVIHKDEETVITYNINRKHTVTGSNHYKYLG
eukprot:7636765-Ditylum_brightwellii.AAC.1